MGICLNGVLAMVLWAVPARGAEVALHRDAAVYHLTGSFEAAAPPALAWSVLTDYNGLPLFVSSVRESRVLRREPGAALIEQEAVGSILFFSRRVKLTLLVRETPPDRISFEQAGAGPFALYEGSWTLETSAAGCLVTYELAVDPGTFGGPAFLAKRALIKNVNRQLDEVRAEMERRSGLDRLATTGSVDHGHP